MFWIRRFRFLLQVICVLDPDPRIRIHKTYTDPYYFFKDSKKFRNSEVQYFNNFNDILPPTIWKHTFSMAKMAGWIRIRSSLASLIRIHNSKLRIRKKYLQTRNTVFHVLNIVAISYKKLLSFW